MFLTKKTIGNHEFDNGISGLVPFLERVTFPVVAANIDDHDEPTIQGKYLKSVVIDRFERKIGVVGVVNSHYAVGFGYIYTLINNFNSHLHT